MPDNHPGLTSPEARRAFAGVVANWRWIHYWFGKAGIEHSYAAGHTDAVLVFWGKDPDRPFRGVCSTQLRECLAYSGVYFDPLGRRSAIPSGVPLGEAFDAFARRGFRDSEHRLALGVDRAGIGFEEAVVLLPRIDVSPSHLHRGTPPEARREAERLKRYFGCKSISARTRCRGYLLFAYYDTEDPYWFVLRSCEGACEKEFRGASVEMLTRGDRGWELTSAGFVGGSIPDVRRLERQIEKAAMLRIRL
jgi:hypothetical protein